MDSRLGFNTFDAINLTYEVNYTWYVEDPITHTFMFINDNSWLFDFENMTTYRKPYHIM